MKLRNSEEKSDAMKRLHDDYRKQAKEAKTDEEFVRMHTEENSDAP